MVSSFPAGAFAPIIRQAFFRFVSSELADCQPVAR